MYKILIISAFFLLNINLSDAQVTAMQFKGLDCNNNKVDLFSDLDSGKAVILHFYMPSCGSCPPPAQKIQKMANGILKSYPGRIKGYAFPFENTTLCSYSSYWTSSNNLDLYAPMDSGEAMVAHYGGFGMPTIVVLGGNDHKVLFSTMSFSAADTSDIKDAILKLFNPNNGIESNLESTDNFILFPNPSNQLMHLNFTLNTIQNVNLEIIDLAGKVMKREILENQFGLSSRQIDLTGLTSGKYQLRIITNNSSIVRPFMVQH